MTKGSMGKRVPKKEGASDHDSELEALLADRMPIAKAVLANDADAMTCILKECLPIKGDFAIGSVKIEKSVGESFTGGHSTPVHLVEAQVCRPNQRQQQAKRRRFVVKLVCMPGNDPYTQRRRESYAVERWFYADAANRVRSANLFIPKLLASDLDGSKPWPAFCILMNDVSQQYPHHPDFLSKDLAACALKWIAKFHALFWGESSTTWRRNLWDRGAFWTTKSVGTEGVSTAWTGTMRYLEQKHPEYMTANTKSLGRRIEKAGAAIAHLLAKESAGSRYATLIHGDYKAANLFFQDDLESADSVAAVDFQFTGGGLGVEDVAYLLYPDARGDHFVYEEELLETYHDELILQLITQQKGGPSTMPFDIFQRYYELSRIDMTRYWLSKNRWAASTAGEAKLVSVLESTMDRIDGGRMLESREEYESALLEFIGS